MKIRIIKFVSCDSLCDEFWQSCRLCSCSTQNEAERREERKLFRFWWWWNGRETSFRILSASASKTKHTIQRLVQNLVRGRCTHRWFVSMSSGNNTPKTQRHWHTSHIVHTYSISLLIKKVFRAQEIFSKALPNQQEWVRALRLSETEPKRWFYQHTN